MQQDSKNKVILKQTAAEALRHLNFSLRWVWFKRLMLSFYLVKSNK